MLESIFQVSEAATISMESCLIATGVAIVLGIVISLVHKFTTKQNTKTNFLLTIAILPVLVEVVILLINGNLGTSFAVAGAFSLIRFRSMPGNSKEIITVFWAMTIGLALGMGYVVFAAIVTVIVAIFMILVNLVLNKTEGTHKRRLKVVIPENLDYNEVFNDIFSKYTVRQELLKVKTTNMGSMFELTYLITLKDGVNEKGFMDDIRVKNGNMLVMLQREEVGEEEL